MKNNEEDITLGKILKLGLLIILVIIGIVGIFKTFYTIDAGQRGVILTFGDASTNVKEAGLHAKVPFAQTIVKMEVRTVKVEIESIGASKDLQDVTTKIAVNYHITPADVSKIYTTLGADYELRIIDPAILETFKSVTAEYTAEELITLRPKVKQEIDTKLAERLKPFGITIDAISLTNFEFSDTFKTAIESKVTAEQNALKEANNLKVVEYQAQQKVESAKGDALSIQVINEQLKNSPDYINLIFVQKWDGHMPLSVGGNSLITLPTNNTRG